LFLSKTYKLNNQAIQKTYSCGYKFPLESEETTPTVVECLDPGVITLLVEIISNPCGVDEVIHEQEVTFSGYNGGSFSKSTTINWGSIDNVGCLNKFPGIIISNATNVRIRITRIDNGTSETSSTDIYFSGYDSIQGTDWFDGGNNRSRESTLEPNDYNPIQTPSINIFDDNEEPIILPFGA
jgi:hypothetical protein